MRMVRHSDHVLRSSSGSVSVTVTVRIACERDEARLRFVAATERDFIARLVLFQYTSECMIPVTYLYIFSNSAKGSTGRDVRFATKTWPTSFSRTGNLGALRNKNQGLYGHRRVLSSHCRARREGRTPHPCKSPCRTQLVTTDTA